MFFHNASVPLKIYCGQLRWIENRNIFKLVIIEEPASPLLVSKSTVYWERRLIFLLDAYVTFLVLNGRGLSA